MSDADDAVRVAAAFLSAQAARDVDAARPLASDAFRVVSPGGKQTGLDALFERLRTAYRSLQKLPEAQDVASVDGGWVVYTHGTMVGERSDGTKFDGVRFLDRLVVRDGKVETQQIWNDFGAPR